MSDQNLDRVREAFKAAFDTDPTVITVATVPSDIQGWDSLGHVKLVAELEKVFSVTFEVDEVMEMEDVAVILKLLSTKGL
jgi:acyl carrier protein